MKVLGVDIQSGSPDSKSQPRYSTVLLEDGNIISREEVNRVKLLRAFRSIRPDRVACDNLFELFPKDKLRRFFFLLPQGTHLIQVNGSPEKMEPLHIVAKRNGIPLTSKAGSMDEADACAKLAYMNVGYEVKAFEDRCKIIVSRARSMGRGGQSQDRYRRKVHSLVSINIKEIQAILDEKKVGYSLETVKADFGHSRGEFLVDLPRYELKEIKSRRGPDVQVKILPVEKGKLSFEPLISEYKDVIVGIDPGTTTALAVLGLEGNIIEVVSRREFSYNDALSFLNKYKAAVIVASDVNPSPKFVEKVSSSLGAILFTPPQSMSVEEKIEIVHQKFSKGAYRNSHERDALAAAIKAHNSWRNKLEQIDKKLEEMNLQRLSREVKRLVTQGESIDSAIKKLTGVTVEEELEKIEAIPDEYRGIIKSLKAEIKILKSERENLIRSLKGQERKVSELTAKISEIERGEYRKLKRERDIEVMEKTIRGLRAELQNERTKSGEIEKKLAKMQSLEIPGEMVLVKIMTQFTREEVFSLKKNFKEGDILYIIDSSGGGSSAAEEILKLKPRCIIADKGKMSHLANEVLREMPIVHPERLEIKRVNGFGIVNRKLLDEEISKEMEKIKAMETTRGEEWLKTFISEYREKRKREIE